MNVDEMYRICQYAINKAQNGNLTPSEFNLLVEQAQNSWADYLIGEFQQYQYGRAQSRVGYGQNSNVRQRLQPFIYITNLSVDVNGFCPYPGDYLQADAMWSLYGSQRVKWTSQDRLYSTYNSKIDPIATNPAYLIEDIGFRFYPTNITAARLSYIKKPTRIYWAYTTDGNGRPIYSPALSEQPKWSNLDQIEIIARVLKLAGVNLKDGDVVNYANSIIQQGQ